MNLKMIAKLAGVSVATVSKAFSGSKEISDKTKERIFEIARQNDCFDKYFKNKYGKKVVAVIYPEIQSNYYAKIVDDLEKMLQERNIVMVSSISDFDKEREVELFQYYAFYSGVDGIIIVEQRNHIKNNIHMPVVSFFTSGVKAKNKHADNIQIDLSASIEEAILCLKELGHTKIGFAGEALTGVKLDMYKKAMRKAELIVRPADIKISSKRFEEAGIECMEKWFQEENPPTAILAAYDYIAVGLARCISKKGLSIPEDFSIVGIDDIPIVSYMHTAISSVKTHTEEACRAIVDTIVKKIENPYYTPRENITIKTEFVRRESIGPCKK